MRKSTLSDSNMSATQSESNQGFGGVAPSAGVRLSTQEVWQRIGDMAGQVSSLATLHDTLSVKMHLAILLIWPLVTYADIPWIKHDPCL